MYGSACAATKISILLFYRRIFVTTVTSFRVSMIFGYFLSAAYPIVIWATMGNACKPLSFYWNQFIGEQGKCIDINTFYLALGIINMLNDIIVLMIPIPQILKLQMSAKKKFAVCGIMLLGSLCVLQPFPSPRRLGAIYADLTAASVLPASSVSGISISSPKPRTSPG